MPLYCLALFDKIFYLFPLFDEILRHIELCNSVISHIQQNPPKIFLQCVTILGHALCAALEWCRAGGQGSGVGMYNADSQNRAATGSTQLNEDDKLYPSTLLEKVLVDFALCDCMMTILQRSMWRKVSSNIAKWSKTASHRATVSNSAIT